MKRWLRRWLSVADRLTVALIGRRVIRRRADPLGCVVVRRLIGPPRRVVLIDNQLAVLLNRLGIAHRPAQPLDELILKVR